MKHGFRRTSQARLLASLVAVALVTVACAETRRAPVEERGVQAESLRVGAEAPLVDVAVLDPSILLDIRYATADNFLDRAVYDAARCLLVRDAAERLLAVERALRSEGYRLVVWDCYRPRSVQWAMWELLPDPDYVADPRKGSRHNRGAAVDVGLRALDGGAVQLPTKHDDFSPRAHRDFRDMPPDAIANRERLERAMAAQGWIPLATEWWHFDAPDWERYPLRDESLVAP